MSNLTYVKRLAVLFVISFLTSTVLGIFNGLTDNTTTYIQCLITFSGYGAAGYWWGRTETQ